MDRGALHREGCGLICKEGQGAEPTTFEGDDENGEGGRRACSGVGGGGKGDRVGIAKASAVQDIERWVAGSAPEAGGAPGMGQGAVASRLEETGGGGVGDNAAGEAPSSMCARRGELAAGVVSAGGAATEVVPAISWAEL